MTPARKEIEIKHILERVDSGMAQISPLVTKNLIEEFEKTGVSPVFSKDGQITGLKVVEDIMKLIQPGEKTNFIYEDQWEDLEKEVNDYKNNFWFLEYDQTNYPSGSGFFVPYGKLLVVSKHSGKLKEYHSGNGSTFPAELIQDIKNNFFQ